MRAPKNAVPPICTAALLTLLAWPNFVAAQLLQKPRTRPPLNPGVAAAVVADAARQAQADAIRYSTPSGYWQPLTHQPQFSDIVDPSTGIDYGPPGMVAPLLLTDGTVLFQDQNIVDQVDNNEDTRIFRLTPDIYGSYVNGTWSQLASKPANTEAGSQAVLADGRVLIEGGENVGYSEYFGLSNQGEIYDPVTNTWATVNPPAFFNTEYSGPGYPTNPIGDAPNVVLADGTFMMGDKMSRQGALLNLKTMTWTQTGTSTKSDMNNEEGWTLLPNGEVLTVDCYADYFFGLLPEYPANPTNSEIYNPATGEWSSAGSTIHTLTDPVLAEIGPGVLRPDGTVFALGSEGDSSIYNTLTRRWSLGPTMPISPQGYQYTAQDAPGVLLPDGNVLVAASGGPETAFWFDYSAPPVGFFEFDGRKFIAEPTIPNAAADLSQFVNLLGLPNGQVLAADNSLDVEIYTPGNTSHNPLWEPVITSVPRLVSPGDSYELQGVLLNGMSQACMFGDELQCATNYPLVRITNLETRHVFYSRTHDHSSMAVASRQISSTHFDVPASEEKGPSELVVVANGIASPPVLVEVQ